MKRYYVPLGRMADYPHPAPDRTATRGGRAWDSNIECAVWTSRGAMLQACRMSDTGILGQSRPYKPLVKP